jgi:hypothetical protein
MSVRSEVVLRVCRGSALGRHPGRLYELLGVPLKVTGRPHMARSKRDDETGV